MPEGKITNCTGRKYEEGKEGGREGMMKRRREGRRKIRREGERVVLGMR